MDQIAKPPKKILIGEDDPALNRMYDMMLRHEGFETILAENGEVGLQKAIENKPNAILLDLMMPVMDGKSMLFKLRETPGFEKTKVFILTNAGEVDNMIYTKKYYDAVEFIIKANVTPAEIANKLKSYLWY